MPRRRLRPIFRALSAAALAGACLASAHAAELGDARVSSHIGQQLVADIELALVDDPSAPVQVRLASPEVYRGAGIAVPPALSTLTLAVMRRDGRQFLHATTLRPVDADHLHLYLELIDKGQRTVRLATLWLTPDPAPVPVPPAPAPLVASAPAPAPATAAAPAVAAAAPAPRPAAAPVRAAAVRAEAIPARAAPVFKLPALAPAGHPAACTPQPDGAKACLALGAKNDALRAQLGMLEDRVKDLQSKLGMPAAGPAAPAKMAVLPESKPTSKPTSQPTSQPESQPESPPASAQPAEAAPKPEVKPAMPKPIGAIKQLVPRKPKEKEPPLEEGGLPWGWIGGAAALLALAGAGAAMLARRKRRSRNVDIPDAPGLLDGLKQRFAARARPASAVVETEPKLD
jgi:hypothetical protein